MRKKVEAPTDTLRPLDEQPEDVRRPMEEVETGEQLERAAFLIISQLPSTIKEFFIETADIVLKIPRWELLAGAVCSQYNQGTLPSPDLDPSWRNPVLSSLKSVCKRCGVEFVPIRFNQTFCSTKCGESYSREQAEKKWEQQRVDLAHRLVSVIISMKAQMVSTGVIPKQVVIANNVYNDIRRALVKQDEVAGLKIKIDSEAPDDRIHLAT